MKLLSKNVQKKCAKYDKLYIFEKPRRIQVCKNIFKICRKTENLQNLFQGTHTKIDAKFICKQ